MDIQMEMSILVVCTYMGLAFRNETEVVIEIISI